MKNIFRFTIMLALLMSGLKLYSKNKPEKYILYVGTQSQKGDKNIYVYQFDGQTNQFQLLQTLSGTSGTTSLTVSSDNKFLYSVGQDPANRQKETDSVTAYSIDTKTGNLKRIGSQPSYGTAPCNISLDNKDRYAFISNYDGGNLAVLAVNKNGSLGPAIDTIQYTGSSINGNRQTQPHVYSAVPSLKNKFLYVTDLGTDKIMIYRINSKNGIPEPAKMPWIKVTQGSGPRHLAFSPSGRFVYLTEELSSKISVFARNKKTGSLEPIQRINSLPDNFNGINELVDIQVHPSGKFLYATNSGHNSLAVFTIDKNGLLHYDGYQLTKGEKPGNFIIDPSGKFLLVANRESDNVVLFEIDENTGKLTYTGTEIKVPAPVCLKMIELH